MRGVAKNVVEYDQLFSVLASKNCYYHLTDDGFDTNIPLSHDIYPSLFTEVAYIHVMTKKIEQFNGQQCAAIT